jgi:predicted TPR repeat methyltransferase
MTQGSRLDALKAMVAKAPDEPRARYFLAHELFRAEAWAEAAAQYEAYVALAPGDEGAALKSLGLCRERNGERDAAADAYRRGIEVALANGHEGLASELRFLLDALDD